jgi:hypothetical protein
MASGPAYLARDWESAAQEAAFEGLCFCMVSDGRFINRDAMPDNTSHRNRFSLPRTFFARHPQERAELTNHPAIKPEPGAMQPAEAAGRIALQILEQK